MQRIWILISAAAIVVLGAAGRAQAPASEIDAHVNAARADQRRGGASAGAQRVSVAQ